ncbi:hypothetical protein GPALN_014945 [Globodera pallida]|nr:hypothetical protein GPALN_014945 [Globodera pallida]
MVAINRFFQSLNETTILAHKNLVETYDRNVNPNDDQLITHLRSTLRACHHGSERVGNIFTPKLHWLLAHGPDFARRWGWFGWMSEQGIEHLHHVLNKQAERFKHFKGDQLLLKIGQHQTLLNEVFDRQLGCGARQTTSSALRLAPLLAPSPHARLEKEDITATSNTSNPVLLIEINEHDTGDNNIEVAFRGLLRKNATRPTCSQALSSACYSFAPVKVSAFALQSLSNNKRGTSASTMVFKDAKGTKSPPIAPLEPSRSLFDSQYAAMCCGISSTDEFNKPVRPEQPNFPSMMAKAKGIRGPKLFLAYFLSRVAAQGRNFAPLEPSRSLFDSQYAAMCCGISSTDEFNKPEKWWISIPPSHGQKVEKLVRANFAAGLTNYASFLNHKCCFISPDALESNRIPYYKTLHGPREFIIS